MLPIRTRYAPSPTGLLHIGGARAALFNYLFARQQGGAFIIRMEDTDAARSEARYENNILETLYWLGIEPDEDPERGGVYGPYRQRERTTLYQRYLETLLKEAKAFYCFHSVKELAQERERLLKAKHPPLHLCEYRTMDPKEADMLKEAKNEYVIRFKTPAGRTILFHDLIHGDLTFASDLLGDFSIAKKIDEPLFHFAVVIDDYEMQISHVIRGEDHISNTPKHLLLFEALELPVPEYGHLPLVLGPDRSRLSKRHGATAVSEYREAGYLPEALLNFMALLGWNPGHASPEAMPGARGDQEIFSKEELITKFSLQKVQKGGAVFDIKKLDWMNGEYIRKKSSSELNELCKPYLKDFLQITNHQSPITNEYVEKIISLEQPRLKKLSEIGERVDYFFGPPVYGKELLRWKDMDDPQVLAALEQSEKIISDLGSRTSFGKSDFLNIKEDLEKAFFEAIGQGDKGRLLWPLRVALTGKKASPGPFEIIEILGLEETIRRIQHAKGIL